jgi:surface protein
MSFFHREFNQTLADQADIRQTHERLINLLFELMQKYQNQPFDSNRYGKLYVKLISSLHVRYEMIRNPVCIDSEFKLLKQYSSLICALYNEIYIECVYEYCIKRGDSLVLEKTVQLPPQYIVAYIVTRNLYANENLFWREFYLKSSEKLVLSLASTILGVEISLELVEERGKDFKNEDVYKAQGSTIYLNMVYLYAISMLNAAHTAYQAAEKMKYFRSAESLLEQLSQRDTDLYSKEWIEVSMDRAFNDLDTCTYPDGMSLIIESFDNEKSFLNNVKDRLLETKESISFLYKKDSNEFKRTMQRCLFYLSKTYYGLEEIDGALFYSEQSKKILEQLHSINPHRYIDEYISLLSHTGRVYKNTRQYVNAIHCQKESVDLVLEQYSKHPLYYGHKYAICIFNLIDAYKRYGDVKQAINWSTKLVDELREHKMEDHVFYKKCTDYLLKYNNIPNIKLTSSNVESTLLENIGLIVILYSESENNKKIIDSHLQSEYQYIISKCKCTALDEADNLIAIRWVTTELLTLLPLKFVKDKKHLKEIYDYITAIEDFSMEQVMEIAHLADQNDMIKYFHLVCKRYSSNKDLWYETYIAMCINIAYNPKSNKEKIFFAIEAIKKISIHSENPVSDTEKKKMIEFYRHVNSLLNIIVNPQIQDFLIQTSSENKANFSVLVDKYIGQDLLVCTSEALKNLDNKKLWSWAYLEVLANLANYYIKKQDLNNVRKVFKIIVNDYSNLNFSSKKQGQEALSLYTYALNHLSSIEEKSNLENGYENQKAVQVINASRSTDSQYLYEQNKKNKNEYYEAFADQALKFQENEYLDELSKTALSNDNIKEVVNQEITRLGNNADLNHLEVFNVTNMRELFSESEFNGNISKWDVSNVTNMVGMFHAAKFNGDISEWDMKSSIDISGMFINSDFNGDISNWNVSTVVSMGDLFRLTKFNGDLSRWDVSNVTDMRNMFESSTFNGDISQWNVSKVAK